MTNLETLKKLIELEADVDFNNDVFLKADIETRDWFNIDFVIYINDNSYSMPDHSEKEADVIAIEKGYEDAEAFLDEMYSFFEQKQEDLCEEELKYLISKIFTDESEEFIKYYVIALSKEHAVAILSNEFENESFNDFHTNMQYSFLFKSA